MNREEYKARAAEMVAMKKQGMTYRAIGDVYGITGQAVYMIVRKELVADERGIRGQRSSCSPAQWKLVQDLRAEGYSLRQLAAFLGLNESTIRANTKAPEKVELPPLESRKAEFYRLAGE
jgi:DNA-binding CsgD family transcriptional regulator